MVFSMLEIAALLDYYAPPVNRVLDSGVAATAARRAWGENQDSHEGG
jgi:hypothetical protein